MAIGDEFDRAFVIKIFDMYAEKLFELAFAIIQDKKSAEECVQEVFCKVVDKVDYFKDAHSRNILRLLLFITCKNTAINYYNQNKRRSQNEIQISVLQEDGDDPIELADKDEDLDRIIATKDAYNIVKELVERLDEKYKSVLMLRANGLNFEEIAELLNITPQLARKRFSRARELIIKMGGDALNGYKRQ
jgi:RNA polymerase sigma-70 factor (ECF subfamily)